MHLIREIFAWVRKRKIAKNIKKNITLWSGELVLFQTIEIASPLYSDVDKLRGSKKSEQVVFSFDAIVTDIQNHNAKIEKLQTQFDSIIDNHKIEKILL